MLDLRGRSASVAGDDGSVDLPAVLENRNGFDSGSHSSRSALVDTLRDERVELSEELPGEPDCDLLGSHGASIPTRDGFWDAQRREARCSTP